MKREVYWCLMIEGNAGLSEEEKEKLLSDIAEIIKQGKSSGIITIQEEGGE